MNLKALFFLALFLLSFDQISYASTIRYDFGGYLTFCRLKKLTR